MSQHRILVLSLALSVGQSDRDCPFGGLGLLVEPLVGPDGAACSHENSISVISRGVERAVCEDCGDSIARYSSAVAGDVKRSQFARPPGFLHKLIELADETAEHS